jgi:sugar phosphate permease
MRRPFYGWYIVGVAFISLFIQASSGGFEFSIFLPAMSAELGWSRSTIVLASSLASITTALASPMLGRIVDTRGPRLVLVVCIVLMGLAQLAVGLVDEPWQFYVAFGLAGGVGRSGLHSAVPSSMIAHWFVRRRATAYGIAAMGPPVANLLIPPVLAIVVGVLGWRAGWTGLGLLTLAIGLAPALLIVRRRPEDLGLRPDGDPPESASESSGPSVASRPATFSASLADWTAREALHDRGFWLVAAAQALIILAPNASMLFMFSYLGSLGLAASTAAVAISVVSAAQVVTRLAFWAPVVSWLGGVRWAMVLWGAIHLTASLMLAFTEGETWAFVAAAILGLGFGGNLLLQLQLWPEYFGRAALGTIIGTAQLVQGTSSAVAPLLLAALLDQTGDYRQLYLIVAGLVAVGLCIHLVVGKPVKRVPAPSGRALG